ncbi:MAG TPA: hypothetical protein VLJ21_03915 [Candidatus Binatia bacterium]|nr:hypothetical protein [Candidatus Binatia bacterium]
MDEHDFYLQKKKKIYQVLESVLDGHVPDWAARTKEALDIRAIAERSGYRVMDGNTAGRPKPWSVLIADPGKYDERVHHIINELVMLNHPVVLLDGYRGMIKHSRAGTPAEVMVQVGKTIKYLFSTDCTQYGIEGWDASYDDDLDALHEMLTGSRRPAHVFLKAVERRNEDVFVPQLLRTPRRGVIQKLGLVETLEGSIQQTLALDGRPYLVLVPTQIGWKRQNDMRDEITPFIQTNILTTIDRITEQ